MPTTSPRPAAPLPSRPAPLPPPPAEPRSPEPRAAEVRPAQPQPAAPVVRSRSRLLTEPVRSGQQIYHAEGDLVIMASVGSGAEVIAEGNIHIYGALRGRAIA